jgi:hypothetical protein
LHIKRVADLGHDGRCTNSRECGHGKYGGETHAKLVPSGGWNGAVSISGFGAGGPVSAFAPLARLHRSEFPENSLCRKASCALAFF